MEYIDSKYDGIRPFFDSETVEAAHRIAGSPELGRLVGILCPEIQSEQVRQAFDSVTGIDDLQSRLMMRFVDFVLEKTSDGVTCSGLENVSDGKTHLLLSGHRDIILDPGIMEYIFHKHGIPWAEIAVGDNLLSKPFVEDMMRSNRMIKVVRTGSNREKYMASTLLSEYIRDTVSGGRRSVWIAHRSGRTKDGNDTTGKGVLKMLHMSCPKDFEKCYTELNIIPLSVSYEFDSCDFMKARELYLTRRGPYVKAPGEDDESMLCGIRQKKGRIHFHFSEELDPEKVRYCASLEQNDRYAALAAAITSSIRAGFKVWPNNYIAYDILSGKEDMASMYTSAQKEYFILYMETGLSKVLEKSPEIDYNELKDIFLHIYANPVTFTGQV